MYALNKKVKELRILWIGLPPHHRAECANLFVWSGSFRKVFKFTYKLNAHRVFFAKCRFKCPKLRHANVSSLCNRERLGACRTEVHPNVIQSSNQSAPPHLMNWIWTDELMGAYVRAPLEERTNYTLTANFYARRVVVGWNARWWMWYVIRWYQMIGVVGEALVLNKLVNNLRFSHSLLHVKSLRAGRFYTKSTKSGEGCLLYNVRGQTRHPKHHQGDAYILFRGTINEFQRKLVSRLCHWNRKSWSTGVEIRKRCKWKCDLVCVPKILFNGRICLSHGNVLTQTKVNQRR